MLIGSVDGTMRTQHLSKPILNNRFAPVEWKKSSLDGVAMLNNVLQ